MKLPSVIYSIYYFVRFIFYALKERSVRFLRYYPGHYSSPIPSAKEIAKKRTRIFVSNHEEPGGIDMREAEQRQLLESFYEYVEEFDFPATKDDDFRYYYKNPMFGVGDAYVLYSFLRKYKPQRYIEIGSGYSSSLVLDFRDKWQSSLPELTFIEPYPVRLNRLLTKEDKKSATIIEKNIQDVPVETFKQLQNNDILFVDSSHLLRIDSDLSAILFSILPVLNSGVLIHFHDIFWPFEYPEKVIDDGRCWNEAYFLRSFLQYNDHFSIVYFQSYLKSICQEQMAEKAPSFGQTGGSSLWLQKSR